MSSAREARSEARSRFGPRYGPHCARLDFSYAVIQLRAPGGFPGLGRFPIEGVLSAGVAASSARARRTLVADPRGEVGVEAAEHRGPGELVGRDVVEKDRLARARSTFGLPGGGQDVEHDARVRELAALRVLVSTKHIFFARQAAEYAADHTATKQ